MPILGKYHATNEHLKPPPQLKIFIERPTDTDQVFFVNYNAKQARLESMIRGRKYDPQMVPSLTLFDYYMGNLSFQELREKRALAYSAYSRFLSPPDLERYYQVIGFIGTQNDKMIEAFMRLMSFTTTCH